LWQVFGGSAPPPVALNNVSTSAGPTASPSAGGGLDGTWTVDATSGSLAEGTSSFAGYRVKEELAGTGANTAVGRTQNVSGSMTVDGAAITAMRVTVDMTMLQSDDSRRDERLRTDGLQTDEFPTATFTLAQPRWDLEPSSWRPSVRFGGTTNGSCCMTSCLVSSAMRR